jgi:hypothetical protein
MARRRKPKEPDLICPHPERCPATTRYTRPHTVEAIGVQCKHGKGHDGDHAGYAGFGCGDVFWPQEAILKPNPPPMYVA